MIKEIILQRFESINKFCQSLDTTIISKQTVYKLLSNKKPNPTVSTMVALAHHLKMDYSEIALVFKKMQEEIIHETINS